MFEEIGSDESSRESRDGVSPVPGSQATSQDREQRFIREALPHSDYLLRNAAHLTHRRVDAEDLLQDTMLKAYLSFDKFSEGSNLKAWLYRIMMNTWIDKYRSSQRRPNEQLSADITDIQMAHHASSARGVLRSVEAEVMRSIPGSAGNALRTLPRDIRTTVYYADVEGYRNAEIAKMLGIPVGTVASRLRRGRLRLRELLIGIDEELCAC